MLFLSCFFVCLFGFGVVVVLLWGLLLLLFFWGGVLVFVLFFQFLKLSQGKNTYSS